MSDVTRRAFLLGLVGAAAAGWVWTRNQSISPDAAPNPSAASAAPTQTTSVAQVASSSPTTSAAAPVASTTTTASPPSTSQAPVRIEALCRDSWGARAASGSFQEHTIERMTVHHTARLLRRNADAPRFIRIHQEFHQADRGWPDIAYHFIIDLEGNVYECRPTNAVGDTGTNYDPTGHFLVCCEGDFSQQELPDAQREALVDMLAWGSVAFGVSADTIAGHRDLAATSCPGENIYTLIESGDLVLEVNARLEAGGVELEVVCGEAAFDRVRRIETS